LAADVTDDSTAPGSLADEAAKLVGAAQQWLHRTLDNPELADRFVETKTALAGLFRALVEGPTPTADSPVIPPTDRPPAGPRLQKIEFNDEPDGGTR
jgi:hypothetical protein